MSNLDELTRNLISVQDQIKKIEDEIVIVGDNIKSVESAIKLINLRIEELVGPHDDTLSYLCGKEESEKEHFAKRKKNF